MIAALLGLAIGIALAILAPGYIPKEYTTLFTVALMAGLDTASAACVLIWKEVMMTPCLLRALWSI